MNTRMKTTKVIVKGYQCGLCEYITESILHLEGMCPGCGELSVTDFDAVLGVREEPK